MTRNLVLLWVGDTISLFGTAIYMLALTLLSASLTTSALGAGTVLFTSSIPYLILGLIGGVYADRWDRKRLMIVCDVARALLVLALPMTMLWGHDLIAFHLAIVGFLVTCFRTFFFPANNASIPGLVEDKARLSQVNGYFQLTRNLAMALGPALAGWLMLLNLTAIQLLFIDSASYAVSAVCIAFIRFPQTTNQAKKTNVFVEAWQGSKHLLFEQRSQGVLLLLFGLQILVGTGIMAVAVPRILTQLPNGNSLYGLFSMVVALSAAGSAALMTRTKVKRYEAWMYGGYLLRGFCFLMLGLFFKYLPVVYAAGTLIGLSYSVSSIPLTTLLQIKTPPDRMGKVVAIRSTLGNLGDAFSYVMVGAFISFLGISAGILMGAFIAILSTGSAILALRNEQVRIEQEYCA